MNLLSVIDKIYENSHFTTFFIIAIIALILLFVIVFIIGLKDSKKSKAPQKENEEDVKDISFDLPPESNLIKEDVTFEMPVLTKNLEKFKQNLEDEIKSEDLVTVRKTSGASKVEEKKKVKVLDLEEIKDTLILDTFKDEVDEPEVLELDEPIEEVEEKPFKKRFQPSQKEIIRSTPRSENLYNPEDDF